jgi:1-phosphofructokinase family hexose kinase
MPRSKSQPQPAAEPNQQVVTVTLNTAIDRVLEAHELSIGAHVRVRELRRYPAGKAINISRALARLGRASIAAGFVGSAQHELFASFLTQTTPGRIDPQLLTVAGRTRENITLIDPVKKTDTHLRDEGFIVTARDTQRIIEKLNLLVTPGSIVAIAGSLPPGMSTAEFSDIAQCVLAKQGRLVIDTAGPALRSLIASLKKEAPLWLLKPNRSELAELLGIVELNLSSIEQVHRAALSLRNVAQTIVVTLGSEGALLVGPDGSHHAQIQTTTKERIINTVGCGDCALAGLIDASLAQLPAPDALRRAVAVATANALSPGVADFTAKQVRAIEARVEVRELAPL